MPDGAFNFDDALSQAVANGPAASGAAATAAPEPYVYLTSPLTPKVTTGKDALLPPSPVADALGSRSWGAFPPSMVRHRSWAEFRSPDDEVVPYSQAIMQMYAWHGDTQYSKWGDLLVELGFVDEEDSRDLETLAKTWKDAVDLSVTFGEVGRKMTPWQAIRIMAGDEEAIQERIGKKGPGGSTTHRSTHLDLTSPHSAKVLINDVLSNALGRRATAEEVAEFTGTLNTAINQNPNVTTTTSTTDEDGNTTSNTTSSGGFGRDAQAGLIDDAARELPEYGAYQSATYYANALFGALDSPV